MMNTHYTRTMTALFEAPSDLSQNTELCSDCRDSALVTQQEKATRLCSTCLKDQLEADR